MYRRTWKSPYGAKRIAARLYKTDVAAFIAVALTLCCSECSPLYSRSRRFQTSSATGYPYFKLFRNRNFRMHLAMWKLACRHFPILQDHPFLQKTALRDESFPATNFLSRSNTKNKVLRENGWRRIEYAAWTGWRR